MPGCIFTQLVILAGTTVTMPSLFLTWSLTVVKLFHEKSAYCTRLFLNEPRLIRGSSDLTTLALLTIERRGGESHVLGVWFPFL